jgi:hypothetical protein
MRHLVTRIISALVLQFSSVADFPADPYANSTALADHLSNSFNDLEIDVSASRSMTTHIP